MRSFDFGKVVAVLIMIGSGIMTGFIGRPANGAWKGKYARNLLITLFSSILFVLGFAKLQNWF